MRKGVALAVQAKAAFLEKHPDVPACDIKIALSLGPLGAMLPVAQEYNGLYPPPYGPQSYDEAQTSSAPRRTFNAQERATGADTNAEHALADFHLARLHVFSEDAETWEHVDCVAFETVPLAREVRAIRRAMGELTTRGARAGPSARAW